MYLAHKDRVDFPDKSPSHCLVAETIITRLKKIDSVDEQKVN